jgi:hypothetical protein
VTIELTVAGVVTDVSSDIPLSVAAAVGSGEMVEKIVVAGVPDSAQLSVGTKQPDGSWDIPLADLDKIRLRMSPSAEYVIDLEFRATGISAAGPISDSKKIRVVATRHSERRRRAESIVAAVLLVLLSAGLFICWRMLYQHAQDVLNNDWSVSWDQPPDVRVSPGPITFWYDGAKKKLHHRGPIDSALKLQLLSLARVTHIEQKSTNGDSAGHILGMDADKAPADDPRVASYTAAIDEIAFESNSQIARYFVYLLSIAGLSGALGTQIRAFANFIYVSTRRNDLDIETWWPWYALRPVLGFLLGLIVVLLVEGKFFVPGSDSQPSGTSWWMGLAMMVGFAADDFAQRLRLVGQALFGKDK